MDLRGSFERELGTEGCDEGGGVWGLREPLWGILEESRGILGGVRGTNGFSGNSDVFRGLKTFWGPGEGFGGRGSLK